MGGVNDMDILSQDHINFAICVFVLSLLLLAPQFVSAQSLNLIEWHESIKKDAIFAWKITEVDFVDEENAGFLDELLIQIKYTKAPPSDPSRIFNSTESPDWFNTYVNGFKIEMEQMGDTGTAFTQLILPIMYHFDNGTSFNLEELHRLAQPIEGLDSHYEVVGNYINSTMGNETIRFTTITNIQTGIATNVSVYFEEMCSMLLEYYIHASNVDEEGESTTIENAYTNFQGDIVSVMIDRILFIVGSVSLVVIVSIIVIRRRG
jgi:hypothetical protein